jgi:REP element-mobilizing transposase RayT
MPDHVHTLLNPFENSLADVMKRIKGSSVREANRQTGHSSSLWQREYFDRQLRSDEDLRAKAEYIALNPVRAGLVAKPDDYPWLWRSWIEGGDDWR